MYKFPLAFQKSIRNTPDTVVRHKSDEILVKNCKENIFSSLFFAIITAIVTIIFQKSSYMSRQREQQNLARA